MRMVVTAFRPRLHRAYIIRARARKSYSESKNSGKIQNFSRPGAIFRRPLDSARARAILSAELSDGEWCAQTRLPYFAHGTLLWYCTQHGLFAQRIDAHKK